MGILPRCFPVGETKAARRERIQRESRIRCGSMAYWFCRGVYRYGRIRQVLRQNGVVTHLLVSTCGRLEKLAVGEVSA